MIYCNNSATSYPKPEAVIAAVSTNLKSLPFEQGRGHQHGQNVIGELREELTRFLGGQSAKRLILTTSATHGLNIVLQGLLHGQSNGHCLTTNAEHNSVLRPLYTQQKLGKIQLDVLSAGELIDNPDLIQSKINDRTRLVAVNHCSNVTGQIMPVQRIAEICNEHGIPCVLDLSQSIGTIPVELNHLPENVALVFTGHKGLYGPTGTGAFYLGPRLEKFFSILQGGTGIRSNYLLQPDELPIYYEAGTLNLSGYSGLLAGLRFVVAKGVEPIAEHKSRLVQELVGRLSSCDKVSLYLPAKDDYRAGILSFNIAKWHPDDTGFALSESFSIVCRSGLHCAPLIHDEIGSAPHGTVRISISCFNTLDEMRYVAESITRLAGMR